MKLLLTSAGLKNSTITKELERLVGRNLSTCKVVYVITAANKEFGDKTWLIDNV